MKYLRFAGWFLGAAIVILSFIFMFNVKGDAHAMILGGMQYVALFCAFFILLGKICKSALLASTVMVAVYFTDRLYLHFLKKRIFASDFYVMFDPNNWGVVLQYKELLGALVLAALVFALVAASFWRAKRWGVKSRIAAALVLVAVVITHGKIIKDEGFKVAWTKTFPELRRTYMNISMSMGELEYKKPSFGNDYKYFADKLTSVEPYESSNLKPNLVLWLQESTFDASLFDANLTQASMFAPVANSKFRSLNRVHTFGGGTLKSEFEILTGLNNEDFGPQGTAVYYLVTPHIKYSLPKLLKKHGYYVVALNPFQPGNYNSKNAYADMGFDEFIHPVDLGYTDETGETRVRNLWYISSMDIAKYTQKIIEKFKDKQPLFIFALTMNEHGPYERASAVKYGLDAHYPKERALELTDYYDRQLELSAAVENMDEYLQKSGRDYVFAYYGDHQAHFSGEVRYDFKFKEPNLITGLYARGSEGVKRIERDMNALGELSLNPSALLEMMQIEPDEFFAANYAMRKLCESVDDCEDRELARSYKSYIYDYLYNK